MHKKLKNAAEAWHALHPGNLIKFNDISKPGGGPGLGHSSHQNGLDVDIEYQGTVALSNELIGRFANDSDCTVIYIGMNPALNDGEKIGREPKWHEDHFHVRFRDPDED